MEEHGTPVRVSTDASISFSIGRMFSLFFDALIVPDSNFVFDFFKAIKNPHLTFFLLKFMEYLTYLTLHGEKVSSNGTQSNHY